MTVLEQVGNCKAAVVVHYRLVNFEQRKYVGMAVAVLAVRAVVVVAVADSWRREKP